MAVRVRRAAPEDAPLLHALNSRFNGPSEEMTAARMAEFLRDNREELVYIAEMDGEGAGFLCGRILRSVCYAYPVGDIRELYVCGKFRGRGVARALMAAIEADFAEAGAREISLKTGADNLPAQRLYEGCGFARAEEWVYQKCRAE